MLSPSSGLKVKRSRVSASSLDASFSKAAIDLAIKREALDQPSHSPPLLSLLYPLRQGASLLASELLKLGQMMPSRTFSSRPRRRSSHKEVGTKTPSPQAVYEPLSATYTTTHSSSEAHFDLRSCACGTGAGFFRIMGCLMCVIIKLNC